MTEPHPVEPLQQMILDFSDSTLESIKPSTATGSTTTDIHYRLIRSQRKTLSISVKRATVEVRAPLKAPLDWIETFIYSKAGWIHHQINIQTLQLSDIYRICDQAIIPVLGKPLLLSINPNSSHKRSSISFNDEGIDIQLHTSISLSSGEIESKSTVIFLAWLKKQAEQYMSKRTRDLANQLGLKDKLQKISYRRTKSKWGHCTSEGNIQYNPLIIMAPLFVVDYIIAHEVCHLAHANHSKRFWAMVEKNYPQRKHAEQWLDQHGHRLAIEINR